LLSPLPLALLGPPLSPIGTEVLDRDSIAGEPTDWPRDCFEELSDWGLELERFVSIEFGSTVWAGSHIELAGIQQLDPRQYVDHSPHPVNTGPERSLPVTADDTL
jgi:hypothetical protein